MIEIGDNLKDVLTTLLFVLSFLGVVWVVNR